MVKKIKHFFVLLYFIFNQRLHFSRWFQKMTRKWFLHCRDWRKENKRAFTNQFLSFLFFKSVGLVFSAPVNLSALKHWVTSLFFQAWPVWRSRRNSLGSGLRWRRSLLHNLFNQFFKSNPDSRGSRVQSRRLSEVDEVTKSL